MGTGIGAIIEAFVAGIEAMGLEMLVKPQNRLWSLNTVRIPEGVSDARYAPLCSRNLVLRLAADSGRSKARFGELA